MRAGLCLNHCSNHLSSLLIASHLVLSCLSQVFRPTLPFPYPSTSLPHLSFCSSLFTYWPGVTQLPRQTPHTGVRSYLILQIGLRRQLFLPPRSSPSSHPFLHPQHPIFPHFIKPLKITLLRRGPCQCKDGCVLALGQQKDNIRTDTKRLICLSLLCLFEQRVEKTLQTKCCHLLTRVRCYITYWALFASLLLLYVCAQRSPCRFRENTHMTLMADCTRSIT